MCGVCRPNPAAVVSRVSSEGSASYGSVLKHCVLSIADIHPLWAEILTGRVGCVQQSARWKDTVPGLGELTRLYISKRHA